MAGEQYVGLGCISDWYRGSFAVRLFYDEMGKSRISRQSGKDRAKT